jgi:hypothetical protein
MFNVILTNDVEVTVAEKLLRLRSQYAEDN